MPRVLLIEPDALLADTYAKALKKAGLHVTHQSNAQKAVMAIDAHKPRVIVLELQLANHNGIEFLHELRSHADWQDIPVILHTLVPKNELHISDELLESQFGVATYLYKPQTSLEQLIANVQAAIADGAAD